MYLELIRDYPPVNKPEKQTTGTLYIVKDGKPFGLDRRYVTVEPPWNDNIVCESCVCPGWYSFKSYLSPKFQRKVFLFDDVPGRSMIEMHGGNTYKHTKGCIIPGYEFTDIDGDGYRDVVGGWGVINDLLIYDINWIKII